MSYAMSKDQLTSTEPKRSRITTTLPFWQQLRWTLIISLILFAIIPLFVILPVILNRIQNQTQIQVERQLTSVAQLKIDEIDLWLDSSQSILALVLANPITRDEVLSILREDPTQAPSIEQLLQNPINDTLRQKFIVQTAFEEFFIYTREGLIIASSDSDQIGKLVTTQPYFANSLSSQVIQSPYYEIGRGGLTMVVTLPLVDPATNQNSGVLAGRLNLGTLGDIMKEQTGLGESSETYLVSLENNYLVTPSRFEAEGYTLTRAYRSTGIDRALRGEDGVDTYLDYQDSPELVIGVYRWLPRLQVAMLAEVNQADALILFDQVSNLSLILMGVFVLAAGIVGVYVAGRISKPITTLTEVATQISQGDFQQQAKISQRNEIGVLATAFNTMTGQLRDFIDSLEERVRVRTQGLEAVAGLSERLSAILSVNELSAGIVNQIQEEFGYYYAHIYLIDDSGKRLVMAEGTGLAGSEMKAAGHSISLEAQTSLVARAARTGQIVRVDNVREAEDWLANPLLPDTHSEMAIPIILESKVVGVFDVQEDQVAAFDDGDETLLRILAGQVAVAIRNARLFEQIERTLDQTRAAQERYTIEAWEKVQQGSAENQYLYARPDAAPLNESKQQLMDGVFWQTINQKQLVTIPIDDKQADLVATPITLNNQTIGAIQIHPDNHQQSWSDEDMTLIQAVLDQFAQTAENLRLFDETRQNAARQKLLADVGDRLRRANNMESLMKTGLEEISKVLGARRALVRLGSEAELTSNTPVVTQSMTNGHVDSHTESASPEVESNDES